MCLTIFLCFFKKNKNTYNKNIFKSPKILNILICLVIGVLSLYLLAPTVNFAQYGLTRIGMQPSDLPIELNSVGNLIAGLFIFGILPAVCEELLFRGIVFTSLKTYSTSFAIIMSSVFFALFHQSAFQFVYPILYGLLLALVMNKFNNIWYCIFIHCANNILIVVNNYISNSSSSTFAPTWSLGIIALVFFALFVTILVLFNKSKKLTVTSKTEFISDKNQKTFPIWLVLTFMTIIWIILFLASLLG